MNHFHSNNTSYLSIPCILSNPPLFLETPANLLSTMPLQLRPATDADGFALGCIGQNAFRDIFGAFIFPPHLHSKSESGDPELDEVHWRATRTLRRMKEGKPTFVAVDVSEDGAETVVGYAQWESPSSSQPPTSELSDVCELTKDPLPPCLDEGNMLEIYRIMETETRRALGPEGHSNMWCKLLQSN